MQHAGNSWQSTQAYSALAMARQIDDFDGNWEDGAQSLGREFYRASVELDDAGASSCHEAAATTRITCADKFKFHVIMSRRNEHLWLVAPCDLTRSCSENCVAP